MQKYQLNALIFATHSLLSLLQTGHTALQRAAAEGHLEIVKTLLENGISVDHQDEVVSNTVHKVMMFSKTIETVKVENI